MLVLMVQSQTQLVLIVWLLALCVQGVQGARSVKRKKSKLGGQVWPCSNCTQLMLIVQCTQGVQRSLSWAVCTAVQ